MDKPQFLYHGSKIKTDILLPHQAFGLPEEHGSEFGIYAYSSFEMARRFALPIGSLPNGNMQIYFDELTGEIIIKAGILNKNSFGYVYKVCSESFECLDDHQWLSQKAVQPLDATIVYTSELWDQILFEGSAKAFLENSL